MNDQEKSLLLYQVMEWRIEQWESDAWIWHLIDENDDAVARREYHYSDMDERDVWDSFCLYLLDGFGIPLFMALAWRIHLWALKKQPFSNKYWFWWHESGCAKEDAQRLWLDKILELIEVQDK